MNIDSVHSVHEWGNHLTLQQTVNTEKKALNLKWVSTAWVAWNNHYLKHITAGLVSQKNLFHGEIQRSDKLVSKKTKLFPCCLFLSNKLKMSPPGLESQICKLCTEIVILNLKISLWSKHKGQRVYISCHYFHTFFTVLRLSETRALLLLTSTNYYYCCRPWGTMRYLQKNNKWRFVFNCLMLPVPQWAKTQI